MLSNLWSLVSILRMFEPIGRAFLLTCSLLGGDDAVGKISKLAFVTFSYYDSFPSSSAGHVIGTDFPYPSGMPGIFAQTRLTALETTQALHITNRLPRKLYLRIQSAVWYNRLRGISPR